MLLLKACNKYTHTILYLNFLFQNLTNNHFKVINYSVTLKILTSLKKETFLKRFKDVFQEVFKTHRNAPKNSNYNVRE